MMWSKVPIEVLFPAIICVSNKRATVKTKIKAIQVDPAIAYEKGSEINLTLKYFRITKVIKNAIKNPTKNNKNSVTPKLNQS